MRIGRALSATIKGGSVAPPPFSDLAEAFNEDVEKLYAWIFFCLDDAISGER